MKKILFILLLISSICSAQTQLAFPSALGDGAYTTGGRGGTVLHVDTLDGGISNTDATHGSLRWACSQEYPRIVVFDISGIITLTSNIGLYSQHSDITIAGQTAPEGGITIAGDRIYTSGANNVICRYIRFKGGASIGNDSLSVTGNIEDHIWDHCSFGFGTDEGASWYSGTSLGIDQNRITIQRCLWNENIKASIVGKNTPNDGLPPSVSVLSNMFYNSGYRFPNIASTAGGRFDIVNNVTWNIATRVIRGEGAFKLNHIGNYYNYGTGSIGKKRTNLFRHGTIPEIYNNGDKYVGSLYGPDPAPYDADEMTADGDKSWGFFQDGGGYLYGDRLPSNYFVSTQHTLLGTAFTPLTADEALTDVTNNVGCNARLNADGSVNDNLDTLDADALSQVALGNEVNRLDQSSYIIPVITSNSRAAGYDTDQDGIPDTYETAKGWSTTVANDAVVDGSGYTQLELFLNEVDKDIVIVNRPIHTRTDANSTTLEVGSSIPTYSGSWTDVEDVSGASTVTNNIDINTIGDYTVTLSYTDTDGNLGTLTFSVSVVAQVVSATSVTVTPSTASLNTGQNIPLLAVVNGSGGNATDQTGVWSSDNANATVNSSGLVTAVSGGSSIITFTSTDGSFTDTSTITITVPTAATVTSRVSSSYGDIKEKVSDGGSWNSSWESYDRGIEELINGTFHTGLNVPTGKTIQQAFVNFTARADDTLSVTINIYAQKGATPLIFDGTTSNVANRPLTTTFATWTPEAWDSSYNYNTVDISAVIQEVIDDPSYTSTDPIVLVYKQPTGTSLREAQSYDNDVDSAPLLTVTYDDAANDPPVISLIGSSFINVEQGQTYSEFGATALDATDGSRPVAITGVANGSLMPFTGTYYVYYNSVDLGGNNATQVVRTIVVSSTQNPSTRRKSKKTLTILRMY